MGKDPPKDPSHKTAVMCSVGKFSMSPQERGEVSCTEENVPSPVPLNQITIRVDRDNIFFFSVLAALQQIEVPRPVIRCELQL